MNVHLLLTLIIAPLTFGIIVLLLRRSPIAAGLLTLAVSAANLIISAMLFGKEILYSVPMGSFGWEFSLRLYQFNGFIVAAAAFFAFLVSLYSIVFMSKKERVNQFFCYLLLTVAFANGAVLADNLLAMLFFWEALLGVLYGMIAVGSSGAYKTAAKAFVIVGLSDLCMMFGIGLSSHLAGTMTISKINLPLDAMGGLAFILLMIGAVSKAGSMPFHSWIPDAAENAPLPFMALLPGALEKLIGIYFLSRITLDMFQYTGDSWISLLIMSLGAITIIAAVMMALVQKDYTRLLSYHAISQVGYMMLGVGTALPAGIIGGLFHMLNNAIYKSCLFFTAGSVERQAGTTDLSKLGGIARRMPVTFGCFFIAAMSISGVPPFNGFFSKEMIYGAALEKGMIFYIAAALGSFFTAASFLKLGHAAYLGKNNGAGAQADEAPVSMLIPMMILASLCIVFGLFSDTAVELIKPVLGERVHAGPVSHASVILIAVTIIVLAAALLNHIMAIRRTGEGVKASEHFHHAPVLSWIYDKAEKRFFDPYDIGMKIAGLISKTAWLADRAIDWIYDTATVRSAYALTAGLRALQNGNYSFYIIWSLLGFIAVMIFVMR